ncbi:MAG TPA: hypothetical protein VK907_01925 [Phnomibacter sp.]|nr:hypothetical protein [Phnomibacter sp.]
MKVIFRSLIILVTLSLTYLIVMAQISFNYNTAWLKVESALEQGKPKTAAEEIDKIYAMAKKDQNEAQMVKAIVYKSRTVQQVEEDGWIKNIIAFEKEIGEAKEPVKQILYSITAELYQFHFERERWKILGRGATNNADPSDPATWSINDFNEKIQSYFQRSLSNPELLQRTPLDKYDPIITKGNVRHLRPTLYDLLAHKALTFLENDISGITKPVYAFELNDQASLAPSKIFIRHTYDTRDTSSNVFKAIRLYQDLIRFHLNDDKPDALIDVDVARVKFAYEKGVMQGKEQFYKNALEHIYGTYGKNEQAMQAGYLLATWWQQKGQKYDPATGTSEDKMAFAIALDYADKVIRAFPKSEGGIAAKTLADEIRKASVGLTTEKVNIIN